MPIHREGSGWQWGNHGKVYSSRKDAERQAAAAHAHGYQGDADMAPNDWRGLIKGLLKFFAEESREPEHSEDGGFAQDPLTAKGNEIMENMQKQYGPEKGKQVFYASKNNGTISGVDASREAISKKISEEVHKGHPVKQAVAIAFSELGEDQIDAEQKTKLGHKIAEEVSKGHPIKQAIAIAYHTLGDDSPYMDNTPENGGDPYEASGVMLVNKDGKALFLKRSGTGDHGGEWAFSGGGVDEGQDPKQSALRELYEETGYKADDCQEIGDSALDCYVDGASDAPPVNFTTFYHRASDDFTKPKLNYESSDYKWASLDEAPEPLHPSVRAILNDEKSRAAIDALITAPSSGVPMARTTIKTRKNEPDTAGEDQREKIGADERLAFDKKSIREYDQDGRLHVGLTPISKACVNPYIGGEIPDYEKLGLKPDKVYKLLRHPQELQKAAGTFNGVPLLIEHKPHKADDHDPDLIAGAVGNDAVYQHPYLLNTLSVWPKEAIDDIENDLQRELSSSYHYRADMTPGVYEGEPYDGIMRDIVGNHVALVREGRAGSDVVVGDSALRESTTSQQRTSNMAAKKPVLRSRRALTALGTIEALLRPKLAADKKFDAAPLLAGLSAKNWKAEWPKVLDALKTGTKDLLAKDADLSDVVKLLGALEGGEEDGDEINPANPGMVDQHHATIDQNPGTLAEFLKGKLSPEDHAHAMQMMANPGAHDESEEEEEKTEGADESSEGESNAFKAANGKPDAKGGDKKAAKDQPPNFKGKPEVGGGMVTQDSMNSAIASAVKKAKDDTIATQRAIRDAEKAVRPWVGELQVACDSASDVYKAALAALKVDVTDVHPSAFKAILNAQPLPDGAKKKAAIAMDAASTADLHKRVPGLARLRVL